MRAVLLGVLLASLVVPQDIFRVIRRAASSNNVVIVQDKHCTSTTVFTCTFASNTTTGNTILVMLTYTNALNSNVVADTTATVYSVGVAETSCSGTWRSTLFKAYNITGGTTPTVTATMTGGTGHVDIWIAEVTGVTTTPEDGTPTATCTTSATSWPSGTVTTSNANDGLFAFCTTSASSPTPPASYTTFDSISGESDWSLRLVTAAGAQNPACTGSSQNAITFLIALKST